MFIAVDTLTDSDSTAASGSTWASGNGTLFRFSGGQGKITLQMSPTGTGDWVNVYDNGNIVQCNGGESTANFFLGAGVYLRVVSSGDSGTSKVAVSDSF